MDPPALHREDVLARYDQLMSAGELLYTPSTSVIALNDNGFPLEFRVCPSQRTKPTFPSDAATEGSNGTSDHPLQSLLADGQKSDIDDGGAMWHLAFVNLTHRVIFNKYCIYRPQYILLTSSPEMKQTSPLNESDFKAAWMFLDVLDNTQGKEHYLIFNCGKPAGGSRMHKHMQVFEQEQEELLPDMMLNDEKIRKDIPYQSQLQALSQDMEEIDHAIAARRLWLTYQGHILWCERTLEAIDAIPAVPPGINQMREKAARTIPHNMILTRRFIMTIPRRKAGIEAATANAAGFMGLVWVPDDEVVDLWKRLGPKQVLAELGVPA